MRVGFPYNAQDHQLFHSLPIAARLSALYPEHEVAVFARDADQRPLIERLLAAYPGHRVGVETLTSAPLGLRWKTLRLAANACRLAHFDALVLPERTSLHLRKMGVTRPKFVHCFHGSSGHDRLDDPRLAEFDLLLAPSAERLRRIAAAGKLKPHASAVTGYVKFDLVERLHRRRGRPFANGRPTILYNPHHNRRMSSWEAMGKEVLDWFAASRDFNLIFAPHVRLFDPPARHAAAFERWDHDNILIDLGSEASIDMSHLLAADIYLGDASSQAFEWLVRPRPMIFLDPRGVDWRADPDYRAWAMGPVERSLDGMAARLASFGQWVRDYRPVQAAMFEAAFPAVAPAAPERAAHALAAYLAGGVLASDWQSPQAAVSDWPPAATTHRRAPDRSAPAPARTGDRRAG